MSFWLILGLVGVAWLLVGVFVLALLRAADRPVPSRKRPDVWGDMPGTFDDWPPRIDDRRDDAA